MEVTPPPYPQYRSQRVTPSHEYRVVFWEHQLPPSSSVAPDEMAWAELTVDLADVQDVHEAIKWAEAHIDEQLNGGDAGRPHGERLDVLCVKSPEEDEYIQIAGGDPTIGPGIGPIRVFPDTGAGA
jgi:hypothetical protein